MSESLSNLSKNIKEKVIRIIGYFLDQWELEVAANNEKQMDKIPLFRLLPESKYKDIRGDIWQVTNLLIKDLGLKNEYRPALYGFSKTKPKSSFKSLMEKLATLKESLEKEVRTKKSYKDNLIHSLAIVASKDTLHYLFIIDEDFENPIEVNAKWSTWKLLLRVAEGEQIEYKPEHKQAIDFLNTNENSKLYTNSGKDLTKILGVDQGKLRSLISLEAISEKAYKQRLNKLKTA